MPSTISAPMSIAGDGTRALIPGIHTTAEDDDDDDDDEVDTSQPLPTARGPAPPRGLGLGSLPPRMAAQEEELEEPPVRRGFADIPRVEDPMPTPRGGRPGGLPGMPPMPSLAPDVPPLAPRGRSSPDEPALEHSSKKPRDDDEEGEAARRVRAQCDAVPPASPARARAGLANLTGTTHRLPLRLARVSRAGVQAESERSLRVPW